MLLAEQKAQTLHPSLHILLQQRLHASLAGLQPQMPLQGLRQLCLFVQPPAQPEQLCGRSEWSVEMSQQSTLGMMMSSETPAACTLMIVTLRLGQAKDQQVM